MGKGSLRSTKRFCKIQRGSLIGSYTRHMCFPSGPITSKASRKVRRITRPRCSGFCCVMWLSISFSCRASSTLLLLIIFKATSCSDCHLRLNCEARNQSLNSQHEAGKHLRMWVDTLKCLELAIRLIVNRQSDFLVENIVHRGVKFSRRRGNIILPRY